MRAPRVIARGEGWSITELTCRLGPHDRPYEERYDYATIAAVIDGTFQYRSAAGTALLYPGSFLLRNAGEAFECAHTHGRGDRCVAFHFDPSLFEEIACAAAGSHRFRFPVAALAASLKLAEPLLKCALGAWGRDAAAAEELAVEVAETVLGASSDTAPAQSAPSPIDQRRISEALRYIEDYADEPLSLDDLCVGAHMSKYHFLRTFRRVAGITPHQFVLDLRMRRAAIRLCTTEAPIAAVAFDSGFGDLSTFNARFKQVFGMSPGKLRRSRQRPLLKDARLPARHGVGLQEDSGAGA